MGAHGLPLIGTGDWNDGLDEIGSQGKGESVWLGFFLYSILDRMAGIIERRGRPRRQRSTPTGAALEDAVEPTWRGDRYLRAIHDDGTEIGVKGSGIWEIDALTAAWAVMSGMNPSGAGSSSIRRCACSNGRIRSCSVGRPSAKTASRTWAASSRYPEGVRENGMYCHGVQWLVGAARLLAEQCERAGDPAEARLYRETAIASG